MKALFVPFGRPRGQPLLVFAMVLGGWLVARVLLWEPPFERRPPVSEAEMLAAPTVAGRASTVDVDMSMATGDPTREPASLQQSGFPRALLLAAFAVPAEAAVAPVIPRDSPLRDMAPLRVEPASAPHYSEHDEPATGVGIAEIGEPKPVASVTRSGTHSRWMGDAWLLLRKGSSAPLAAGRPAYGRSQAGAVLRYRLAPESRHRPVVYARATRSLAGEREQEVAGGVAVRPLPGVPMSVAAEARIYDSLAGEEVRLAAFAVIELPPVDLPLGLRGEAYAQAGYVSGRFATAFADGQARVDSPLSRLGEGAELRIGAAAWGGAQKHAERIDIGPSAAVSVRLGRANARVAVDYRFRIAGDAEPTSGPALTFSAGF